jgi:hypothetical protein
MVTPVCGRISGCLTTRQNTRDWDDSYPGGSLVGRNALRSQIDFTSFPVFALRRALYQRVRRKRECLKWVFTSASQKSECPSCSSIGSTHHMKGSSHSSKTSLTDLRVSLTQHSFCCGSPSHDPSGPGTQGTFQSQILPALTDWSVWFCLVIILL